MHTLCKSSLLFSIRRRNGGLLQCSVSETRLPDECPYREEVLGERQVGDELGGPCLDGGVEPE